MKNILRVVAAVIALSAIVCWFVTGRHVGWTQTTVGITILDPVTGIEGVRNDKCFIMGVDLLACALFVASLLGGASLFFRGKDKPVQQPVARP